MKKTALLIAAISALSLASCKKDRTCTCTNTYNNGSTTETSTTVYTVTDAKKGDAKKMCIDSKSTNSYEFGGVTYTTTSDSKCELK